MKNSRINLFMFNVSKLKYIFHCDGLVIKVFLQFPQLRFLKVNIHGLAACKCGSFWTHSAVMQTSRFVFMFDASKLRFIYLCDGLVKIFLQLPQQGLKVNIRFAGLFMGESFFVIK